MTDLCRCLVINQSVGQITDGLEEKSADHQIHPEVNMNAQWPKRICCMLYIFNCKLNILTFTVVVFGVHETVLTVLQLSPTSNFKGGFLLFVLSSRSQLSALIKDTQHTENILLAKYIMPLGHTLCVSMLHTRVGLFGSMLLDPIPWHGNYLALLKLYCSYRIWHCRYPLLFPLLLPSPQFLLQYLGQTPEHFAWQYTWCCEQYCVCVCMMSVNLFGSECHFKSLHVTYTHG